MTTAASSSTSTGRGIALSVLVATVAAGAVNSAIALIARALGADPNVIIGLQPAAYLVLTLIGTVLGAVGWVIVRNRASDPAAVLRVLVPAAVVVSLIPDLLLGLQAGWGVLWLVLMHPVVATAAVLAYRRFLPLPGARA